MLLWLYTHMVACSPSYIIAYLHTWKLKYVLPSILIFLHISILSQWLALHSRPVFRDGFLLAYTMWCWNSCWVGSALSFPVGFSSNSKKEAPIGVPGTSKRSVPTLTGEGINTHTHTQGVPSALSFWVVMIIWGMLRYFPILLRTSWFCQALQILFSIDQFCPVLPLVEILPMVYDLLVCF